jgi:hypothetical protein
MKISASKVCWPGDLPEKARPPLKSGWNDEDSEFEPGIILAGFKKSLSSNDKMSFINQLNLEVVGNIDTIDILKIRVDPGTEVTTINSLRENPNIEFVEPNYVIRLIR